MAASTQWQLVRDAAEQYEKVLVPAILGPAAHALVDWAAPAQGALVVDVGTGTGAAARRAATHVGTTGRVVGVDVNADMIAVAQALPSVPGVPVEWHQHSADALPLDDAVVDLVLLAQALQFMPERLAALAEARRVLRPGGRLAVSLWCPLPANPYFEAIVAAVTAHLGADVAAGLQAAFGFSEAAAIRALLAEAGFSGIAMTEQRLDLDLPPPNAFVPAHICATPMVVGFRQAAPVAQMALVDDVAASMSAYATDEGLRVPFTTHLIQAQR